jgi:hypothetical protein
LWVVKDVAEALGYPETTLTNLNRLTAHVPKEWKGRYPIPTPSGTQQMVTFTEQGLYFFLGRSDKPAALPLQMMVAGKILPAIRKTGSYAVPGTLVAQVYPEHWTQDAAHKIEQTRRCSKGLYEVTKDKILPALEQILAQLTSGCAIAAVEPPDYKTLNAITRATTKDERPIVLHRIWPSIFPAPRIRAFQPGLGLEA